MPQGTEDGTRNSYSKMKKNNDSSYVLTILSSHRVEMKELNSQICKLDQLICWRDSRDYLIVSHIRENIFNRWGFYNVRQCQEYFLLTSHHYNYHHEAQYGKTLNLDHAFKTVTETLSFIN